MRRAIRVLANEHPPEILHKLTLQDIKKHRDPEWFAKEKGYHEAAVAQLNSLVRKYNGLAPYSVRRPYYSREVETGRLYEDCAEDIMRMIADRVYSNSPPAAPTTGGSRKSSQGNSDDTQGGVNSGYFFIRWLRELLRWLGVTA